MTWVIWAIAALIAQSTPLTAQPALAAIAAQPKFVPFWAKPAPPFNVVLQRSRAITVQIQTTEPFGSGILIRRQGMEYTVLTNRHVVQQSLPYLIQTLDGVTHPVSSVRKIDVRGTDLALLTFQSPKPYAIAHLGSAKTLRPGDSVLAAGFPLEPPNPAKDRFFISVGKISLLPLQAFAGGYRIGYTNLILQGMSGGPVLNQQGEVVGINSLHAHPLWGDPYVFEDGSKPSRMQHQQIRQLSWAVPIDRFLCLNQRQHCPG